MQKRVSNSYFNFTRKERNGTIFLLAIILLVTILPFIYSLIFKEKIITADNIQHELSVLKTKQPENDKKYYQKSFDENDQHGNYQSSEKRYAFESTPKELFYFDPNTISADGWKKLGLREKTINTIQNFISKGGKFRQPDDIKKIWGLHEDEIARLLPFVKIESPVSAAGYNKENFVPAKYEQKRSFEIVDINLADTSAWINLPGIGSKLANRIILFREKLGGFYRIEQVAETFGLPDSVFQKIKQFLTLNNKELKQVNINVASLDELKQHPYIRYNLANSIVQYRTQHGKFLSIADIKKIMIVNDELYARLSAYLAVE